jgi:hypothetical protein
MIGIRWKKNKKYNLGTETQLAPKKSFLRPSTIMHETELTLKDRKPSNTKITIPQYDEGLPLSSIRHPPYPESALLKKY